MTYRKLSDLQKMSIKAGHSLYDKSKDALKWLERKIKNTVQVAKPKQDIITDTDRERKTKVQFGEMYLFEYNPKTKNKLPYFDQFPLVIPIKVVPGGFIGLNFHYLPPKIRAWFFHQLTNDFEKLDTDGILKIIVRYETLRNSDKHSLFHPCIKRYYYTKIVGNIVVAIPPEEWSFALLLPLQNFHYATDEEVWEKELAKLSKMGKKRNYSL